MLAAASLISAPYYTDDVSCCILDQRPLLAAFFTSFKALLMMLATASLISAPYYTDDVSCCIFDQRPLLY